MFNTQNSVVRTKASAGRAEMRVTACSLLLDMWKSPFAAHTGDCWLCLKSSFETFQVAINPAVRKALFHAIDEKQLQSVFFHLWLFAKTHKSELG